MSRRIGEITIMRWNKKIGSFSIRKQFSKSSNFNANSFQIRFFIKICKDQGCSHSNKKESTINEGLQFQLRIEIIWNAIILIRNITTAGSKQLRGGGVSKQQDNNSLPGPAMPGPLSQEPTSRWEKLGAGDRGNPQGHFNNATWLFAQGNKINANGNGILITQKLNGIQDQLAS